MPSPDERSVGDDDGDDFPPPGGKFPRQNSSARALDWFRLVAAEFRPERLLMIFFLDERPHIAKDGYWRANRGPTRQGARPGGEGAPPPSWPGGGPPVVFLPLNIFLLFSTRCSVEFQDFWSCAE